MASALVDQTSSPLESREKDALEQGENFEDAGGMNTPSSTNELTSKERAALTRRLLWKLDLRYAVANWPENKTNMRVRILPVLTLLFLCSFLDRTNVGNAKTYNLETDVHMTDFQYETGLAVYYATYIAR
jgi:hypothetical protein